MSHPEAGIIASVDALLPESARQVAKYAVQGYTPKEIARILNRSLRAVNRDIERITAAGRKAYHNDRCQFQRHLVPRLYSLYHARGEISETEIN